MIKTRQMSASVIPRKKKNNIKPFVSILELPVSPTDERKKFTPFLPGLMKNIQGNAGNH